MKILYDPFLESKEWRDLRFDALNLYGKKCMLCNKTTGVLQVDHIVPRIMCMALALKMSNLQILCMDCNLGKSFKVKPNGEAFDYRNPGQIKAAKQYDSMKRFNTLTGRK